MKREALTGVPKQELENRHSSELYSVSTCPREWNEQFFGKSDVKNVAMPCYQPILEYFQGCRIEVMGVLLELL